MTLQRVGRRLGTVKLSRIPLGPCVALVWHLQDGGDRVQLSSGNKALFQFGFKWFIQWLTSDLGLINFIFCEWGKLLQGALCEHNFLCITWNCAGHQWLPCMYWVWGLWCIYTLLFQGYRKKNGSVIAWKRDVERIITLDLQRVIKIKSCDMTPPNSARSKWNYFTPIAITKWSGCSLFRTWGSSYYQE